MLVAAPELYERVAVAVIPWLPPQEYSAGQNPVFVSRSTPFTSKPRVRQRRQIKVLPISLTTEPSSYRSMPKYRNREHSAQCMPRRRPALRKSPTVIGVSLISLSTAFLGLGSVGGLPVRESILPFLGPPLREQIQTANVRQLHAEPSRTDRRRALRSASPR